MLRNQVIEVNINVDVNENADAEGASVATATRYDSVACDNGRFISPKGTCFSTISFSFTKECSLLS